MPPIEIVITGVGAVTPIGIGREAVWEAFCAGRSGVGPIRSFDASQLPVRIASEVRDFDPKPYVKPRKNLKIMSRDAQIGVTASVLACEDAGITGGVVDPERFGVILGADRICGALEDCEGPYRTCLVERRFEYSRWGKEGMADTFPLSFLKVLPNMTASHISIAHDARGPNNTIHQGELSSLEALSEAARTIQRGAADVIIAGGASSQMNPYDWVRHCRVVGLSTRQDDPTAIMRPFDIGRDGEVWGEGAAAFIVESRQHAETRGATILARLLGWASTCEPHNGGPPKGAGLQRAISLALTGAGMAPRDLGHVNAHGASTVRGDRMEARALGACVPDVPVTAPKSYFGNLGAASGAVELRASILSFTDGRVPASLNCRQPDPDCPVEVIRGRPLTSSAPTALAVNWTWMGQAAAVVLAGAD